MVAFLPLLSWLCLAATSSTVVFEKFVKPRLPVYTLQVDRLPRPRWIEGSFKTQLPTRVLLHNENYVGLDVHALTFDLFYTHWWDGSLQHLGYVQDRHQQTYVRNQERRNNNNKTSPVWQIRPRAHFDYQDDMFMGFTSFSSFLSSLITLAQQFWKGRGSIILPSTGVAHVQTSGIPATVSMICDNVVHTLMMEIQGLECTLQDVLPGWVPLDQVSAKIRNRVQTTLTASPETGGIYLQERTANGFARLNATETNAWQNFLGALQIKTV